MLKHFLQLIKPGIILGNLVSVLGGYYLASNGKVFLPTLFAVVIGTSLVIASGCVLNNFIDQDIDAKMKRTQNRTLVKIKISAIWVFLYAAILGGLGFLCLYFYVNLLASCLALIGMIVYVGFYSLYFKRNSTWGVFIGSFSGAMPPVIGYTAVSHQFDLGALLLLLLFSVWQMIHSYAIGIFRLEDYKAANVAILPVVKGIAVTRQHMLFCAIIFLILNISLTFFHYTGLFYLVIMSGMSLVWFGMIFFIGSDPSIWARRLFIFSIIIVVVACFVMACDSQVSLIEKPMQNVSHLESNEAQ